MTGHQPIPADEPEILWRGHVGGLCRRLLAFIDLCRGRDVTAAQVVGELELLLYADYDPTATLPPLGPPPNSGHRSTGTATEPGS
jgi:hypothetical protein